MSFKMCNISTILSVKYFSNALPRKALLLYSMWISVTRISWVGKVTIANGIEYHHHHHHYVHEGLGVFPVPWSSKWSWSLLLFFGRPMFLRPFGLYCSAYFVVQFVSFLCTCFRHFFWYCFTVSNKNYKNPKNACKWRNQVEGRRRWENYFMFELKEIWYVCASVFVFVDWIHGVHNRDQWRKIVKTIISSYRLKGGEFPGFYLDGQLVKKSTATLSHGREKPNVMIFIQNCVEISIMNAL